MIDWHWESRRVSSIGLWFGFDEARSLPGIGREGARLMQFWDENSGVVQLNDNMPLLPHMDRQALLALYANLTGEPWPPNIAQNEPILALPAFAVPGGRLACVCLMHGDKLHAAEFTVVNVGQRKRGTADQQRALLFQCLHGNDPSKDSKRGVLLRCPFGTALVATDPRSGDAMLRLTYR